MQAASNADGTHTHEQNESPAQLKKFKDQQSSYCHYGQELLGCKKTSGLTAQFDLQKHLLDDEAKSKAAIRSSFRHEAAILSSFRKLGVMESIYRFLLGEKIQYQMGEHGPNFDLFFLCVLMNQKELAFELWKHTGFPVRTSLVAVRLLHLCPRSAHAHNQSACASACALALTSLFTPFESWTQVALFRAMADKYFTQDPVVSESMRDNADFFETVAIEVQTAAMEDDEQSQAPLFVRPALE